MGCRASAAGRPYSRDGRSRRGSPGRRHAPRRWTLGPLPEAADRPGGGDHRVRRRRHSAARARDPVDDAGMGGAAVGLRLRPRGRDVRHDDRRRDRRPRRGPLGPKGGAPRQRRDLRRPDRRGLGGRQPGDDGGAALSRRPRPRRGHAQRRGPRRRVRAPSRSRHCRDRRHRLRAPRRHGRGRDRGRRAARLGMADALRDRGRRAPRRRRRAGLRDTRVSAVPRPPPRALARARGAALPLWPPDAAGRRVRRRVRARGGPRVAGRPVPTRVPARHPRPLGGVLLLPARRLHRVQLGAVDAGRRRPGRLRDPRHPGLQPGRRLWRHHRRPGHRPPRLEADHARHVGGRGRQCPGHVRPPHRGGRLAPPDHRHARAHRVPHQRGADHDVRAGRPRLPDERSRHGRGHGRGLWPYGRSAEHLRRGVGARLRRHRRVLRAHRRGHGRRLRRPRRHRRPHSPHPRGTEKA